MGIMKYRSVFDIIGPIMIGPSSSHTAGAARIGIMARFIFGKQPSNLNILFFGSFAKTFKGHGTDIAVVGGVLGFNTFDKRMVDSLAMAEKLGVKVFIEEAVEQPNHPNTVRLTLTAGDESLLLEGISIGGGKMEVTAVDDFPVRITGESPTLLIWHEDRPGLVASISKLMADHQINIGYLEMARKAKGSEALMVIETDHEVKQSICEEMESIPFIRRIKSIPALS